IGKLAESQQPVAPVANTNGPLANPIDERYAQALKSGDITLDDLAKVYAGKAGEARRLGVVDRARTLGWNRNAQLSAAGQNSVATMQPVLDQANKLLAHIDDLKLGNNNTSGYLLKQRILYGLGQAPSDASDLGNDIAGLSLGSVVEAASALKGSSRSLPALQ